MNPCKISLNQGIEAFRQTGTKFPRLTRIAPSLEAEPPTCFCSSIKSPASCAQGPSEATRSDHFHSDALGAVHPSAEFLATARKIGGEQARKMEIRVAQTQAGIHGVERVEKLFNMILHGNHQHGLAEIGRFC